MTWIATYSGRMLDYADPQSESICIEDIARGLASVPRFSGQTKFPYSVAQHSVLCSRKCRRHPLAALLHDATEAYMGDCTRPLKALLGPAWKHIEDRLLHVILRKYGIFNGINSSVKSVDNRMLFTERAVLQPNAPDWGWACKPYVDTPIEPWTWQRAYDSFMGRFTELTAAVAVKQVVA